MDRQPRYDDDVAARPSGRIQSPPAIRRGAQRRDRQPISLAQRLGCFIHRYRKPANPQTILELLAEYKSLRVALDSCAEELAAEVICKHGGQKLEDMHPVTRRLYERDMAPVVEARAVLAKGVTP